MVSTPSSLCTRFGFSSDLARPGGVIQGDPSEVPTLVIQARAAPDAGPMYYELSKSGTLIEVKLLQLHASRSS